ncbi:unnamed protein product [Ceratitis capitata]|uniref:(Mediterranean fruit fly) hypothetical protein n=1 Tax=Ceratitis capitata TaxID=7213 RepID=A0A811USX8_CERCA|nr:unnamed protein product [Ceratitis capitata]
MRKFYRQSNRYLVAVLRYLKICRFCHLQAACVPYDDALYKAIKLLCTTTVNFRWSLVPSLLMRRVNNPLAQPSLTQCTTRLLGYECGNFQAQRALQVPHY